MYHHGSDKIVMRCTLCNVHSPRHYYFIVYRMHLQLNNTFATIRMWSYPISRSSSDTSVENLQFALLTWLCFAFFLLFWIVCNVSVKYATYTNTYYLHTNAISHFIIAVICFIFIYKNVSAINLKCYRISTSLVNWAVSYFWNYWRKITERSKIFCIKTYKKNCRIFPIHNEFDSR